MANTPLTGNTISSSYQGLLKTGDSSALGATEKPVVDGLANASTMTMGTGGVSFTSGTVDFTGATVSGLPAGSDTTYDLASAQNASNVDVNLTGSDATTDTVTLAAGTNITLTDNGSNQITIDAAGGGAAGLESGTGTDSMQSAASLTTTPANAAGNATISLGDGATSSGTGGISIGDGATTSEVNAYSPNDSIAIGVGASIGSFTSGIAIGKDAQTSGAFQFRGIAVGQNANAGASDSMSFGRNSVTSANGAVALGSGVTAATADTVSVKALEVQTDSTPTAGGIIMSDAGGTDRRINIDATGGLQIDSTPVGGGGGGGAAGPLVAPTATMTAGTNLSFYLNVWKPIIPIAWNSFPNADHTFYSFGTSNPARIYPTSEFNAGSVIDEIEFYVKTASATFDSFTIALHDSYIDGNGDINCGPMLTVLTSNATLVQSTGWKSVTGIGYTVPATTSGENVYFISIWTANSSADASQVKFSAGTPQFGGYLTHYSTQTGFGMSQGYESSSSYTTYPTTGNIAIKIIGENSIPVIGFR